MKFQGPAGTFAQRHAAHRQRPYKQEDQALHGRDVAERHVQPGNQDFFVIVFLMIIMMGVFVFFVEIGVGENQDDDDRGEQDRRGNVRLAHAFPPVL